MVSQKKFSTFSEQVEWLREEKHLVIADQKYAENILQCIGYFPLMGGYKHLFRTPLTKKYKEGTSFEEKTEPDQQSKSRPGPIYITGFTSNSFP